MPLKLTAIALCSCSNLCSSSCPLVPLAAASSCAALRLQSPSHGLPVYPGGRASPQPRGHATYHRNDRNVARESSGKTGHPNLQWPASAEPTPYEIFNLSKTDPYSKVRFYELVKLYHPDRQHHTCLDDIPHLTKLERYRQVVAANNILSDPARRRLYDLYGAGWAGEGTRDVQSMYRDADRTWRQEPGNPSMNGTWEDWERWHSKRNGEKQEPVYMSNGGFVGIIMLVVLVGGIGQVTRAGSNSATLVDMRDQKDSAISQDMRRKQVQSMGLSRRDRVQSFLKQRESWEDERQPNRGHLWHDEDVK